MKKILKSNRGLAIESAILFMLVLMTFSILISTVVMTAHSRVSLAEKQMKTRLELEQIGENFVNGNPDIPDDAVYENTSKEENVLILTNKSTNSTVLYIKKDAGKAIVWRYTMPSP